MLAAFAASPRALPRATSFAADGPSHDWPTFDADAARSGSSDAPTGIDAGTLASLQRQQVHVDGIVDAAPIYLAGVTVRGRRHDAFFVTTSYGKTLAIDADDGSTLWTYTPPGCAGLAGTPRITNATPVADPDRQFIYAASPDGHVQKLSVADGHAAWSTAVTTLPEREKIASALNYFKGRVIVVTGGYIGDEPPYQGHVAVLDAGGGHLEHVWNTLCSDHAGLLRPRSCHDSGSAIWGRAGAVVDPDSGHLFVATGNGRWDGRTAWGDAVLELDADATRILGNYTPADTRELDDRDEDLGSTSPVLLAGGVIAQGGKDRKIRLLDLHRIAGTTPHRGGEVQTVATPADEDLFTAPAVWREGRTTWLFAADNGGTAAWTAEDGRLTQHWRNRFAGTSPVVAGGLLYVYDPHGGGLRVYEPRSGRVLNTLACGSGHWNSPIVADGRIALPEGNANRHATSGALDIWRVRK